MLTDKKNVLELAALMRAHGIRKVVLCPGSRNIPLVQTFSTLEDFECYAVTDERSAGFFAMGLALNSGEPAAVCCTSGTALLNLHPAVAEASYQHIPLLVISADRPQAWIDQMDGQTLKQTGVFDRLGIRSATIEDYQDEEGHWFCNRQINEILLELKKNHPAHLNLPLREPLFNFTTGQLPDIRKISVRKFQDDMDALHLLVRELGKYRKVMLVSGQMRPSEQKYRLPEGIVCVSEHLSNDIAFPSIQNADQILAAEGIEDLANELAPDLIITLGGHIVSKRFKKFIRSQHPLAHWHIDPEGKVTDLFCCVTQIIQTEPETFLKALSHSGSLEDQTYGQCWTSLSQKIKQPVLPYSEMAAIGRLVQALPEHSVLHLANSSAVRYAQLFEMDSRIKVLCNRGTSGIEGSLSTAAGYAAASDKLNFVIIGDLSFFYDANALWNSHIGPNLRILLLNNGGGEIFKTLPRLQPTADSGKFILGQHHTSAEAWTEEMGFEYHCARNEEGLADCILALTRTEQQERPVIAEVFTDSGKDAQLLKEYYKSLNIKHLYI